MKNKLLIALTLAMVLSLTFAFVACNGETTVTAIKLVDGSFKTEYIVGEKINFSNAKLKVTFSDGTNKEIALTADMLNKAIDTSTAGETTYTITYKGATATVVVVVTSSKDYSIETFELPSFITNALDIANTEGNGDANFKVAKRIYEVGNANAFLVKCVATGYDLDDNEVTLDSVKTTYKVQVGETENNFAEPTDLAKFVTVEDGYKFFFTKDAAGKFVKLTISLDTEEYDIGSNVIASRTIKFKVIDNGYNVYDQDGLSVMNDSARPELWAGIWGCTVDASGKLQPTDNAVTLDADNKPLYQYVGNIDWVILHGDITINADKLPADFFWNTTSEYKGFEDEISIKDAFTTAQNAQKNFGDTLKDFKLEGTLIDGNGYGKYYSVLKNETDENNNKGLYSTTKVSVSGNYNAITVDKDRTESGRILKVLINRDTADNDKTEYQQISQWYVFKMFEPLSATGEYVEPATEFVLKNIALIGNGGRSEAVGPQGVGMINSYAKQTTVDNVVGSGFYTNLTMDNFKTESETAQSMVLSNSKLYDTYNAMVMTWRGAVTINNSMLKRSGGPLFVLMDANNRDTCSEKVAKPAVIVDDKTEMDASAIGSESWYAQLGSTVPAIFAKFDILDAGLSQISGRTIITKDVVGTETYSFKNVLAVMIPSVDSAFTSSKFNYYIPAGKVDVGDKSYNMDDTNLKYITSQLAQLGQGTVILKSGTAYAYVWKAKNGKDDVIISQSMLLKQLQAFNGTDITTAFVDTSSAEYLLGMQEMMADWRANASDELIIWTQAETGKSTSPYLGIVLGSYHVVDAQ